MATSKPAIEPIWGSASALKTDPGTVKTNAGWIVEKPPVEWMNWLQNRFNEYLAHLNERGIPQWDATTTYLIKALVYGSNGTKYEAVQENSNNDPTTDDGTNWLPFGGSMLIPKIVPVFSTGADATVTVGIPETSLIEYTGAALDANIGVVTDIDNPAGSGGWTDLIDISGGRYSFQFKGGSTLNSIIEMVVASTETVGDSLRLQALIDSNVIFDIKAVNTGVGGSGKWIAYRMSDNDAVKDTFVCNDSLLIRAARVGNFAIASSLIRVRDFAATEIA